MEIRKLNKGGQVWVETVIYTLIGLSIIGILLAVSKPKIDEMRDNLLIEQTIESLNEIDSEIREVVNYGAGNQRDVELKVSRGRFVVDSVNDSLYWILNSDKMYSEPGEVVKIGERFNVTTTGTGPWEVRLSISSPVDLTYDGGQDLKEINAASTPYKLYIRNAGGGVDLRVG